MWKFTIKQDNLTVARGQAKDKEVALGEAFHYACVYAEEDFNKMVVEIKKEQEQ